MNDTIKKFTVDVREAISAQLQSKEMQDFIAATKAAEDTGSFEVVISTADVDRDGESIDQNGWDLSFYLLNPVVLWAHDYSSLPIGVTEGIAVKDGKLVATGKFAPESANPFAQQVRRLYDLKIVRATSVGFIVLDMNGRVIMKAQLLEFSFVPVPANPYALSLSKAVEMGLNTEMLAMKGIKFEEAEAKKDLPETPGDNPDTQQPEEGKPCKLSDGTDGTYQVDDSGALVCQTKVKQPTDQEPQEGQPCTMSDGSSGITQIDENGTLVCVPQYEEKPKAAGTIVHDPNPMNCASCQGEIRSAVVAHQKETKTAVIAHSERIVAIVARHYGELVKQAIKPNEALPPKGSEGEESHDGAAPKERSSRVGQDEKEELELFLLGQSVLRAINNATSEALEKFNKRPRSNSHGRKNS